MPSFACGQLGCIQTFTWTSDHTKHIWNHHLSQLNIWPNIHVLPQSPSPPTTHHSSTRSRSPPQDQDVHQHLVEEPQIPELIDDDNNNNNNKDMNTPDGPSSNPILMFILLVTIHPHLHLSVMAHLRFNLELATFSIQQSMVCYNLY